MNPLVTPKSYRECVMMSILFQLQINECLSTNCMELIKITNGEFKFADQ